MTSLKSPLAGMRARLLVSHMAVCAVGIVVLFVAVRLSAPSFFQTHIGGMALVRGPGGAFMTEQATRLDDAVARSLNEGFLIAVAIALPLGVLASFLVAGQVSAPVKRLAEASHRIAQGEYKGRVLIDGPTEIAELASSFNAMAAALEQVEQRRVELIGEVAHELRTPVTVLRGYVEGLADGVFPASAETWSMLSEETARLSRLVEELQELSRAEAGQFSLAMAPVNPLDAINTATARLTPEFAKAGLVLDVNAPKGLPPVQADFDRLVQILTNLLTNALRYTPAPGTVTVAVGRDEQGIAFSVRDTGIGIPAEHLPFVFERFYRVDPSRARSSGGSGVGLTIAQAMAAAMGGKIRAASAGSGQGSTFTLLLPATKQPIVPPLPGNPPRDLVPRPLETVNGDRHDGLPVGLSLDALSAPREDGSLARRQPTLAYWRRMGFMEDTAGTVLVIQAHPDDADISSGGTVAWWSQAGRTLVYVTCTSGEAGSSNPPLPAASLGPIREQEQRQAAAALGVSEVVFLRYPDGALEDSPALRSILVDQIMRFQPTTVVTHDPVAERSGHPDHWSAGRAAIAAILEGGAQVQSITEILLFRSSEPNRAFDVSGTILAKLAALEEHRTQRSLGEAPADAIVTRAKKTGLQWGLAMAESFKEVPLRELAAMLRAAE